jgi:hypothetical protein
MWVPSHQMLLNPHRTRAERARGVPVDQGLQELILRCGGIVTSMPEVEVALSSVTHCDAPATSDDCGKHSAISPSPPIPLPCSLLRSLLVLASGNMVTNIPLVCPPPPPSSQASSPSSASSSRRWRCYERDGHDVLVRRQLRILWPCL